MSLLAAVLDWRQVTPDASQVGALLSALPGRSPDGRAFARAPHAVLGFGSRIVRQAERRLEQPIRDHRAGLLAVADLRIDNRADLRRTLSKANGPLDSDLALLLAAYERWGVATAEKLIGDFAFVIWDERERQVYAARDPFGVRSLVYHQVPAKLIFATDPAQLLSLPEIDRSPDTQAVVDLLGWSYGHYGATFFRAIRAVRPGNYLVANADGVREVEYFQPPDQLIRYRHLDAYREDLRWRLREAVRARMDSDYPVVAHLSGGLDSSSIVCMAGRILEERRGDDTAFHLASAVFPGQPHDESRFIHEVTRGLRFPHHVWDGNIPSGREFSQPSLGLPGSSVVFNGGSSGDIEIAARVGARVILSGDPGDFVTGEIGLLNEMLCRGRWLSIAAQIGSGATPGERRARLRLLKHAIREEAPPALLAVWRTLNSGRPTARLPAWPNPDVVPMWAGFESRSPPLLRVGVNRLQQRLWDYLRWSRTAWSVDLIGAYAASAGVEVRFPLLDLRLVRFFLAIPPERRSMGPRRRSLYREAMTGIVPESILGRTTKTVFGGAVVQWGHRSAPAIREILEGSQWFSEAFADRKKALEVFRSLTAKSPSLADREGWLGIRALMHLETWLRAVFRYAPLQETAPMYEIRPGHKPSDASSGGAEDAGREVYVPPTLTPVGNVRELLATLPGSQDDGVTSPADPNS